ncbi:hypothetical protein [Streptomyces sp. NPDC048639]|uniref:hypothetical protein n=1 Tax=Streptomyces sp. NPDC048639 TaxID=3365581 RepID=UPI0037178109
MVLIVFLCALALPLRFAAKNTYRYIDGHRTTTEGHVNCQPESPCRGVSRLPGGQRGKGEIEGLNPEYHEELVTDIPVFAGRDWAVADRSDLMHHAYVEVAGTVIGAGLVLNVAWDERRRQ